MVRRSSRSGVKAAKAKAKAYIDYLDAPDSQVLSGALPPVSEAPVSSKSFTMAKDRLKNLGITAWKEAKRTAGRSG